jgi:hypothetical protein
LTPKEWNHVCIGLNNLNGKVIPYYGCG